jgi:hypothetical protein
MNGGAVAWNSKLQRVVAVSTAESEYMAAAAATKEAVWLRKLLSDLSVASGPLCILTDNQASLALLQNPVQSNRSKHIDIIFHFAREKVAYGAVYFAYCPTTEMAADFLTKAVTPAQHKFCMSTLGIK